MFSSIRSYGFPGQFVTLSKETDSLKEAQKVNTLSTSELLKQGWQMRFVAGMASPVSLNALVNVVADVLFYLVISFSVYYQYVHVTRNMKHRVLTNIVFNGLAAMVFVLLNIWALDSGLEETFITLAIFYGTVVIVGNALYISIFCKK